MMHVTESKQIGKVGLYINNLSALPNEIQVVSYITINDIQYSCSHMMPAEMWNDSAYLKSVAKRFLYDVVEQEYEIQYHKELNVKQEKFLYTLYDYVSDNGLPDESKFLKTIMNNGGYGKDERKILNKLRKKYIDEMQ